MRKSGICPDCGAIDVEITSQGICTRCRQRKTNAGTKGKEYIPYINLSDYEKQKIDNMRRAQSKEELPQYSPIPAKNKIEKPQEEIASKINVDNNSLSDTNKFVDILRGCGCEIQEKNLKDVLNVLFATNKLKDIFMTIVENENQKALLDLEQALNVAERKLQHDWEYNGFQEADDMKFKSFLTWRRNIKGAIYFWKKLYSSNTLIELQKAWNAYTSDPTDKVTLVSDENRTSSALKRYQITTETTSTIFNTRRNFTRVFYAISEQDAREKLTKWLSDRQLHEDKSKTTVIELGSDGIDGRLMQN